MRLDTYLYREVDSRMLVYMSIRQEAPVLVWACPVYLPILYQVWTGGLTTNLQYSKIGPHPLLRIFAPSTEDVADDR